MSTWRVGALLPLLLLASCAAAPAATAPSVDTTQPASVTTSSTAPASTSTSTAPPTTTTAGTDPGTPVSAWLDARRADGLDQVLMRSYWSTLDAVLVTAFTTTPSLQGDVVLAIADGRTVPLPPEIRSLLPSPPTEAPDLRVTALDGDPLVVLVAADRTTVVAARLDPDSLTWTIEQEVSSLAVGERLDLYRAGDAVLFAHRDLTVTDAYQQWGEILAADGTVTRMAAPPDGVPIWFTNDAAGRAWLLGLDTVAGDHPDLRAPVAFDPATNEWLTVPVPDWVTCPDRPDGCVWGDRHEWPDRQFFRTTTAGIVVTLPDGSIGVLDPVALTWRRLDDPPMPIPGSIVAVVGDDRLLVLPGPDEHLTQSLGTALWLDVTDGSWSATQVADLSGSTPPVWWEARWWGPILLLGADADEVGNPPIVAIDLDTGTVRAPLPDELAAWPALVEQMPIADAITAWELQAARD